MPTPTRTLRISEEAWNALAELADSIDMSRAQFIEACALDFDRIANRIASERAFMKTR